MNEIVTLMENYWVCREQDRELYNKVKRDTPNFRKFAREQLGWKLLDHERFIKLEKVPAHAESFMGILEFQEIRDYVILCVILLFLEDKEEQEQFLLSELIDFVGMQLQKWMEVDWNSFSQRRSLVRVLQYVEQMGMLKVYEGNSQLVSQEIGQEVLYENTGLSRYFATSFPFDLRECSCWEDLEKERLEELETDRGRLRVNRVYRRLVSCPAMYWDSSEDADSLYLKNQRQWVARYMEEALGGRLDIHKNAAFWVLREEDHYGQVHPKDGQLAELVLLLSGMIREKVDSGQWMPGTDEKLRISQEAFADLVRECRGMWQEAWSKEYREMEEGRLLTAVKGYMRGWMMLSEEKDEAGREGPKKEETEKEETEKGEVVIYPAVGKLTGYYPADLPARS